MQKSSSGAISLYKSNMLVIQKHKDEGKKSQNRVHLNSLNQSKEGRVKTEDMIKLAKQFQAQASASHNA